VSETSCPDCRGQRTAGSLDQLAFHHGALCLLAADERETLAADQARHARRGLASWHRLATDAERELLGAAGHHVPAGSFTRVVWLDPRTRRRTWRGLHVVAIDEAVSR